MDLLLAGERRVVGAAGAERRERDTVFTVSAALPPGLWRIVAEGTEGELVLGVMEGGSSCLHRRFSHDLTRRLGAVRAVRAERSGSTRMESEWRVPLADDLTGLPPLPPGAVCRTSARRRTLALPWQEESPFPWPQLFCFAREGAMGGRRWLFFTFDEAGAPVLEEEN